MFHFFIRNRFFTLINVLGLALSLACCIMLTRYLHREYSVDSNVIDGSTAGEVVNGDSHSHATLYFNDSIRKIVEANTVETCRYCPIAKVDLHVDTVVYFANILMVDSTYLHFFDLDLVGDRHALSRPDAAYISRPMAQQIFGNEDPLGKSVQIYDFPITIAGVFDYPSCKQSIVTDLYVSYLPDNHSFNNSLMSGARWIRLASPHDKEKINQQLNTLEGIGHCAFVSCTDSYIYHSHRVDFAMNQKSTEMFAVVNANDLRILNGVNILIMLIGIFNFVNLYMVLMQRRKREWGVRKVFGQKSWGLFRQVWLENLSQVLVAVFVAWLMVEMSKGYITDLMDFDFGYTWFDLQMTLVMILAIPAVAALYPFVQYLIQPPVATIQSEKSGRQNIRVRLFFLASQYLLTLCILVSAIWFNRHFEFLMERSGMLKGDRVYVVEMNHYNNNNFDEHIFMKCFGVVNDIYQSPFVESCDMMGHAHPIVTNSYESLVSSTANDKSLNITRLDCGRMMFRMFDIPLVEGDIEMDSQEPSDNYFFLVNETAFRQFGFTSLEDAYIYATPHADGAEYSLMSHSYWNGEENVTDEYGRRSNPVHVKAVVKDYYCSHATEGVKPMMFVCSTNDNTINIGATYSIRPKEGKDQELLAFLREVENRYYGNEEFFYHTFQDEIDELYSEDRRLTRICTLFAGVAILICCLGLLGLSLFDIRQRYREIAIRKAHGAHRKDLYLLLGKKYLWTLLSTFILSIPITYLFIHSYAESFIESALLTPWIYLEALAIVIVITALTLISQLEKAARVNVSTIIKTE